MLPGADIENEGSEVSYQDLDSYKEEHRAADTEGSPPVSAAFVISEIDAENHREHSRTGKHDGSLVDIVADKTPADPADECEHGDTHCLEDGPRDTDLSDMFVNILLGECFVEHVCCDDKKQNGCAEITEFLQVRRRRITEESDLRKLIARDHGDAFKDKEEKAKHQELHRLDFPDHCPIRLGNQIDIHRQTGNYKKYLS